MISAVFLVPLALLATLFTQVRLETIDSTKLERRGMAYVKEAAPLLLKVAELRRLSLRNASGAPPTDPADAREVLDNQLAVVEALDKSDGATLGISDALAKVRTLLHRLAPASEGLMSVYASHVKLSAAMYDLISAAADELNRLDVTVDERSKLLSGDAAKVAGAHPDAKAKLDTTALAKALEQLRGLATDSPGTGGKEEANKLLAAGNGAIHAGKALQSDMINMLDERLAARIERITRAMAWVAAAILGSLAVSAYLFYAFFLVMNGGLREMRHHVDLMADGDLTRSQRPAGKSPKARAIFPPAPSRPPRACSRPRRR